MYVGICKLETLVNYFENRVAAVAATEEEEHFGCDYYCLKGVCKSSFPRLLVSIVLVGSFCEANSRYYRGRLAPLPRDLS